MEAFFLYWSELEVEGGGKYGRFLEDCVWSFWDKQQRKEDQGLGEIGTLNGFKKTLALYTKIFPPLTELLIPEIGGTKVMQYVCGDACTVGEKAREDPVSPNQHTNEIDMCHELSQTPVTWLDHVYTSKGTSWSGLTKIVLSCLILSFSFF